PAPEDVAHLQLALQRSAEQREPFAHDEIEPEAGILDDVGLRRRAVEAATDHALARISQQQRLLRQPLAALEPDLEIDEVVRLAGERRTVAEEVARASRRGSEHRHGIVRA